MKLFYRGHPEIGMGLELPIKPRRSGLLRTNAQEIRTRITGTSIQVISAAVVAITAVAITTETFPVVPVAGFE